MQRPDDELVEGVRAGDREALAELFNRYWRAARAAALAVTGNWATAEDAASEGFWHAIAGIDSLQDAGRFAPWLRTIVARSAKAQKRKEARHDPIETLDFRDTGLSAADLVLRCELNAVVQKALSTLPARLREALALVYFEGYESEQAARFLGIPAGTLRRRLHEGRARLRDAAKALIERKTRVNDFDQDQTAKLQALIAGGNLEDAMREILLARPPRQELLDLLRDAPIDSAMAGRLRLEVKSVLTAGSDRSVSEDDPVRVVARLIRKALPEFQEWQLDPQEASSSFFTQGEHVQRLKALLPPGFTEGDPGAFLRQTRSLILLGEDGEVRSIFEAFQRLSPSGKGRGALADVLDLTWMSAGPVNLHAVQEILERIQRIVAPDAEAAYASYTEPRYRAALQLELAGTRAAMGGVLAEWPGCPSGVGAAHVRLLLEPWAAVLSGQPVHFSPLPPG